MTGAEKHEDHSSHHQVNSGSTIYTCSMHPEVRSTSPGTCPKCGMKLVPIAMTEHGTDDHGHTMKAASKMERWEKFRMSMTMMMGMEHTGVAGREMAWLMELDVRNKFFFALYYQSQLSSTRLSENSSSAFNRHPRHQFPGFSSY